MPQRPCIATNNTKHDIPKSQQTRSDQPLPISPRTTLLRVLLFRQLTNLTSTGTPSQPTLRTHPTSAATLRRPTRVTGHYQVTTTAQQAERTRTCEHIKHSTSTPQHACVKGFSQNTAQTHARYNRGMNKASAPPIQVRHCSCRVLPWGGLAATPKVLQPPAGEPREGGSRGGRSRRMWQHGRRIRRGFAVEEADTLLVWHWGRVTPGDGGLGGVVGGKRRCIRVRTERCAYLARHVV